MTLCQEGMKKWNVLFTDTQLNLRWQALTPDLSSLGLELGSGLGTS